MNKVAVMSAKERSDLFRETANRKRLRAGLIEKDFWVCWSLERLFTLPEKPASMIFKGGTSLSKVFGAIGRFSEDVDLSLNREDLGFTGDKSPEQASSSNKAKRLIDELSVTCQQVIRETLLPEIERSFATILEESKVPWSVELDPADPQTINFAYPVSDESSGTIRDGYVKPIVRLEIGARSDHWPAEDHTVRSYAAEEFPSLFESPTASVRTLSAERTFWEKATILHSFYHKPIESPLGSRQSRHYYDLAQLYNSPIGESALKQQGLLAAVVQHKTLFFRSAWANYDTAAPGTLRLIPPPERHREIGQDYDAMGEMMFGTPPSLEEILEILRSAEQRINDHVGR